MEEIWDWLSKRRLPSHSASDFKKSDISLDYFPRRPLSLPRELCAGLCRVDTGFTPLEIPECKYGITQYILNNTFLSLKMKTKEREEWLPEMIVFKRFHYVWITALFLLYHGLIFLSSQTVILKKLNLQIEIVPAFAERGGLRGMKNKLCFHRLSKQWLNRH